MKFQCVLFSMALALALACSFSVARASSFEDEATPIEREDIKTIDQINSDTSFEDEATPIEREDIKTIDQIK